MLWHDPEGFMNMACSTILGNREPSKVLLVIFFRHGLLRDHDALSFFGLAGHASLPTRAVRFIQVQSGDSILRGRVGLTIDLNFALELLLGQLLELARTHLPKMILHEGLVVGRVTDHIPGMLDPQALQVVREPVAHNDLASHQVLDFLSNNINVGGVHQVLSSNSRDKGAIIGYLFTWFHVLIENRAAFPVHQNYTSTGRFAR
mmetsp:Transcript_12767/g.24275  ORF Transcript_12767/g.24275 Transcript_12767/m.24275 type:complete len:204 (+) Transcript_12767:57-668(+)